MQDANTIGTNGRYVVERVLGEQSVGRYIVAVDTIAGGRVTILVPSAQAVRPQRIVDALTVEIQRLAPLVDTAYCTLKDTGLTEAGEPFAVVNRPQGGSLAALIRSEGRLSPDRAVSIAVQLCDLVRRAHVLGIFPIGLDPDSIIVDSQPGGRARVAVVDFGLARGVFGPQAVASTRARSALFDSPQLRAGVEPDPRDDVFSVTALLHAMILGVAPPAMASHGPADGSGWPGLPDDTLDRRLEACLHTVLLRGLAPDRDDRFAHIGALQRGLTGLRQLMALTVPAFELLAATRGRLGQGPDALDMRTQRPAQDRAAEARARIREVAAIGQTGQANLSALNEQPRPRPRLLSEDDAGVQTGDFQADDAARGVVRAEEPPGMTRPLARFTRDRHQGGDA